MYTASTPSPTEPKSGLTLRELVSLSLISAILIAFKEVMSFLPNIEPVTMLLICTTLVYGAKAFYPCAVFVLVEGLLYGFGWYFFVYVYIWPILVGAVLLLRRHITSYTLWTVIGALYGLFFGPLCCIEAFVVSGWRMAFSFWISGIPYDILHCVGNAFMCGVLLKPLTTLLKRLAYPQQIPEGADSANDDNRTV